MVDAGAGIVVDIAEGAVVGVVVGIGLARRTPYLRCRRRTEVVYARLKSSWVSVVWCMERWYNANMLNMQ